jgi:hypothetical protein
MWSILILDYEVKTEVKLAKLNIVRFTPRGENSFYDIVISRVDSYFETIFRLR